MSECAPSKTSIAVIMLDPRCNMQCRFCITENAIESVGYSHALTLLDWLALRGFDNAVLGGGEPFMWRGNVLKLALAAKKMGWLVQVGTNGTLLPDGFEHIPQIDRFVLPIESTDPNVNDNLRLYHHSHHTIILDRLAKMKAAGKQVTLSTIVTAQNIGGLKTLADFLKSYASGGGLIHAWHLYQFIPEGRGGGLYPSEFLVHEKKYDGACAIIKKSGLPFPVFKRKDMYHSASADFFWRAQGAWHSAKFGRLKIGEMTDSRTTSHLLIGRKAQIETFDKPIMQVVDNPMYR